MSPKDAKSALNHEKNSLNTSSCSLGKQVEPFQRLQK